MVVPFALTLTGMRPHDEQVDHRFYVDGKPAAVFVPVATDHERERWLR